ncbi:MAG: zinc carboxypeptidase [Flavobacteriaceae bacterium]|nr:zinc carboxypeptidase [Flavobacteriaceae bacterium]
MHLFNTESILEWYQVIKQRPLHGRWIRLSHIQPILHELNEPFTVQQIGNSTLNNPIYSVRIGSGKTPVLIWSQMHGNESTGTKALFDLINFFDDPKEYAPLRDQILENCQITMIPMLNPDGAEAYTRENASDIDLNRDVIDQKAPETKLLLQLLKNVNPEYCFNLHDQRIIYTVGDTNKSATISFLAPSENQERTVTQGRKETMKVIVAMNAVMQKIIPGQIGRYKDEFYPTATGDNFQKMGHNTILIEAGHDKDDYDREQVRAYNFIALLQGLNYISSNESISNEPYEDIPNNTEYYFDVLYKDVFIASENKKVDAGIVFKEILKDNQIHFEPEVQQLGDLKSYAANTIVEDKGLIFADKGELQRFHKKRS